MKNLALALCVMVSCAGVALADEKHESKVAVAPVAAEPVHTIFSLPDGFLGDLVAVLAFGLIGVLVIVVGFKLIDKLTPGCHFMCELAKNNTAVGIFCSSVVLGLCYLVAQVAVAVIKQ